MRLGSIALVAALAACSEPPATLSDACADWPVGPHLAWFRDVGDAAGITFASDSTDFRGNGIAVADFDRDGLFDIAAGSRTGGLALYLATGPLTYSDHTLAVGLDPGTPVTALAAADLDNDGDPDLAIATPWSVDVMDNDGTAGFSRAAAIAHTGTIEHILPADIDGDGSLDLYLSNRTTPSVPSLNLLVLSAGQLRFAPAIDAGGGLSWAATAFDFDADGDQDIYVANDTLAPDFGSGPGYVSGLPVDLLLRNDGRDAAGAPVLVDVAASVGLDEPRSSMGHVVADVDGDGRLDIYVTNYGAKKLLSRGDDGQFRDRAAELGLDAPLRLSDACPADNPLPLESCLYLSWSSVAADFDLDGRDELIVASSDGSVGWGAPATMLMRPIAGTQRYEPIAPIAGCDDIHGLVAADVDRDGDVDLVLGVRGGPLRVAENVTESGGNWLRVALRGRISNRDGVGAQVRAHLADGRTLRRLVTTGGSVHSSGPAEIHFGLGTTSVEVVDVEWPSGRKSSVTRPAQRAAIVIDEPP